MTSEWCHFLPISVKTKGARESSKVQFKDTTDWFSTKHADWTWISNRQFSFPISVKFLKIAENLFCFPKFPKFVLSFHKSLIYVKYPFSMNMCAKFQIFNLTTPEFCCFECPQMPLLRYLWGFWTFPIFKFCPISTIQKVFWGRFSFLVRIWQKPVSHHPNAKF